MNLPRKPFRFSVLTGGAATKQEWIDKACRAEDLGFDSLLFGDHVHNQMGPLPAMAAAAMATRTLRFGSYMFGNDFRNPVLLAHEALTVDQVSDGRLDLGLGTGYMFYDYTQLGITLDSPVTRIRRLEEAVKIIKGYFGGRPFEHQGKYYNVKIEHIGISPVQQPHPPILMGGGGKQMISLAAREADIVSFNPRTTREGWFDFTSVSLEATDQKMLWFLDAAGERAAQVELSMIVPICQMTKNERHSVEIVETFQKGYGVTDDHMTVEEGLASPHILLGSLDAIEEKVVAIRERFGVSHFVFSEPLEQKAEIVKRLAGR
jgi:probable F420-dependent oxidoreductase